MALELPYPWGPGTGLSPILRDPQLWAKVFEEHDCRRAVKRAARAARATGKPHLAPVDDNVRFGEMALRLLENPSSRSKLEREVKTGLPRSTYAKFVTSRMYQIATERNKTLPSLDDICTKRDDGRLYLALERLDAWLDAAKLSEQALPDFCLLGCAFAILQPGIAAGLLDLMQRRFPSVTACLIPEADHSAHEESRVVAAVGDPSGPAEPVDAETTPPATNAGPVAAGPRGSMPEVVDTLLQGSRAWDSTLTPTSLRTSTERLRELLERAQVRLEEVSQRRNAVQQRLARVSKLPWFKRALLPKEATFWKPEAPIAESLRCLAAVDGPLSKILDRSEQLTALAARLDRRPPAIDVAEAESLAEALSSVTAAFENLKRELEQINATEQGVARFLDRFSCAGFEDACRLLAESGAQLRLDLYRFVAAASPKTEDGRRFSELAGDKRLGALALASLWHHAPEDALRETNSLLRCYQAPVTAWPGIVFLEFLSFGQLQSLAEFDRDSAPAVLQVLLAVALARRDVRPLKFLEPLFHLQGVSGPAAELCRELMSRWPDKPLLDPLHFLTASGRAGSDDARLTRQARYRVKVLELIARQTGMTGNFRILREEARTEYMEPLRQEIEAGRAAVALARWQQFGTLEEMVLVCVRALEDRQREASQVHRTSLLRYLENFDREVRAWCAAEQETLDAPLSGSLPSLEPLRRDAVSRPDGLSARVLSLFDSLTAAGVHSLTLPRCLGTALPTEGFLELSAREAAELCLPGMVRCWASAVAGELLPVELMLQERLAAAVGSGPGSFEAAIEWLATENHITAASSAAEFGHVQPQVVSEALSSRRTAILHEHCALLEEAAVAREHDQQVDSALREMELQLDVGDFSAALEWIPILQGECQRYARAQDPIRQELAVFLADANIAVRDDDENSMLLDMVEELRRLHSTRRAHLTVLRELKLDDGLPPALREAWGSLPTSLDRPGRWPEVQPSDALASAIRVLARYAAGKWKYREADGAMTQYLLSGLQDWLPRHLDTILGPDAPSASVAMERLHELVREVESYAPDQRILATLGYVKPPTASVEADTASRPEPLAVSLPRRVPVRTRPVDRHQVVQDLVVSIRASMAAEQPIADAAIEQLRSQARAEQWQDVRSLAAAIKADELDDEAQCDVAGVPAVYAIARALSAGPVFAASHWDALQDAVLAWLCARDLRFYLDPAFQSELFGRILVGAMGQPALAGVEDGPLKERLAISLELVSDMTQSEPLFQWLAGLFWNASLLSDGTGTSGSAKLASQLWDLLTASKDPSRARAHLLYMLHRFGRGEALRHLAHALEPLDALVAACCTAFERADTDPHLRLTALQLSAALREQSKAVKNTKPFLAFFCRLEGSGSDPMTLPLDCRLESEYADRLENGYLTIDVRLRPMTGHLPETLQLRVGGRDGRAGGGAGPVLEVLHEPLFKEKVVSLTVPDAGFDVQGEELRIPYQFTGLTILKAPIDVRGVWTLRRTGVVSQPLTMEAITRAWPGATGHPVTKTQSRAFHGRQSEMRRIEGLLNAPDRQQSVMVFGQRRIGKTSLLLEVASMFPPSSGRIAGVFVDISGLTLPDKPGSIPKAFFDKIVGAIESRPENTAVHQAIEDAHGSSGAIRRLAHGLDPTTSLADALETFAEKLATASKGRIPRLAILIDEFDRFVVPLLSGRRDEVDAFMWQLRQIVQRSPRIALVLAGSGLQRLLIQNYQDALYGSIPEVNLEPFDWDRDRDAILSTFLPDHVQTQLCREGGAEALARKAHTICGGHPWFLAMLGFSAAVASGGRFLTSGFLNHVVEQMLAGTLPDCGGIIDCRKFYMATFLSLDALDSRTRAIAKLLLAHLAQRVTLDYPTRPMREATEAPELLSLTTDDERYGALQSLIKERVLMLDKVKNEVGISVPLTAAGLREDSFTIRHEALQELRRAGGAPVC